MAFERWRPGPWEILLDDSAVTAAPRGGSGTFGLDRNDFQRLEGAGAVGRDQDRLQLVAVRIRHAVDAERRVRDTDQANGLRRLRQSKEQSPSRKQRTRYPAREWFHHTARPAEVFLVRPRTDSWKARRVIMTDILRCNIGFLSSEARQKCS